MAMNKEIEEAKMTNSKQIAGLIGPTIVVLTISEMLNFHIWATNFPQLTYLNGLMLFVAGLSIIRAHNRWVRDWSIFVTLAGWFVFLGGLFRMFAPEAQQAPHNTSTFAVMSILLGIGVLLTFKAYSREGSKTPSLT